MLLTLAVADEVTGEPAFEEAKEAEPQGESAQVAGEDSFEEWDGNSIHRCSDLVYKLSISNTRQEPI